MVLVAAVKLLGCGGSTSHDVDATVDVGIDTAPAETSCFDGLDDNGDGLVDCAEPTCASISGCVSAIPLGWSGHAALYEGPLAGAPICPTPFIDTLAPGNAGLVAPPASCTSCACGAPTNGACPASGGIPNVVPATWSASSVACEGAAPAAIGCDGADDCQPRPVAPFLTTLCIHQNGDTPCPTGSSFTERHVFYAALFDTRDCAACTCGAPSGGACAPGGGGAKGMAMQLAPSTYCCLP